MKTIIQVWTHKVCNLTTTDDYAFWGIGDMIRGTIKLYQLCKRLNYKFIVDLQHHPIAELIELKNHEFFDFIKDKKEEIPFVFDTDEYIRNSKEEVLFFVSNNKIESDITSDCKNFIKDLLTPNKKFLEYYNEKISSLKLSDYTILHYRLGDNELVRDNFTIDYNFYMNHLNKNKEENSILMSDSKKFKDKCKDSIIMIDTEIGHLGYHKDINKIRDTLVEFFIISKSRKIKTLSVNGWVSGFVDWIHKIYDIPLSCM
jgi:hypothetical protein